MIDCYLNGEKITVKEGDSLSDILVKLKQNRNGIALAINDSVIPKTDWELTYVKSDDKILIIQATQGG